MITLFTNQPGVAQLIYNVQLDATQNQLHVSDFQWFVITLSEAIEKSLVVDLRLQEEVEYQKGKLQNITIDYTPKNPNPCILTFDYENTTKGKIEQYSFTFNAEQTEENKLSVPGDFMKYYLKDDEDNVILTLVFHYK